MTFKLGRDTNGNKLCKVIPQSGRGFSIQTNGNLPETDRHGVGEWTRAEVARYVWQVGTERQKTIMGIPGRATA